MFTYQAFIVRELVAKRAVTGEDHSEAGVVCQEVFFYWFYNIGEVDDLFNF